MSKKLEFARSILDLLLKTEIAQSSSTSKTDFGLELDQFPDRVKRLAEIAVESAKQVTGDLRG